MNSSWVSAPRYRHLAALLRLKTLRIGMIWNIIRGHPVAFRVEVREQGCGLYCTGTRAIVTQCSIIMGAATGTATGDQVDVL